VSESNQNLVATVIFTVAALTDWLDGWLARKLNQTSAFGEFLDPVADKLMVAAALVILVQLGRVDAIIASSSSAGKSRSRRCGNGWPRSGLPQHGRVLSRQDQDDIADDRDPAAALLRAARYPEPRLLGTWLIWIAAVLTLVSMRTTESRAASRLEAGCLSRRRWPIIPLTLKECEGDLPHGPPSGLFRS